MTTVQDFLSMVDTVTTRINALLPLLDEFEKRAIKARKNEQILEQTQNQINKLMETLTTVSTRVDVASGVVVDVSASLNVNGKDLG